MSADVIRAEACPVREALDRVGGKWSLSVLAATTRGPVRFLQLARAVTGVSRRMLVRTLRAMERDGLLSRTAYATVPPRVEYQATEMGRELYAILSGLATWADRRRAAMAVPRGSAP